MKIRFHVSFGGNNCHEEIREYPDDTIDAEIEADYGDWVYNFIDGSWSLEVEDEH